MTPSAGASRPSIARCEKWGRPWMPSSTNVPSSINSASRSRAASLSRACCAAIFSGPPPSLICSRRACRSSASGRSRLVTGTSVAMARSETSYFPLCQVAGAAVKHATVRHTKETAGRTVNARLHRPHTASMLSARKGAAMTYIETVPEEEATGQVAEIYELDRQRFGHVPNFTKAFSARPAAYQGWLKLMGAIKKEMDLRRFELATVAAARRLRSSYCTLAHGSVLLDEFMAPEEVRAVVEDYHSA